MKFIQRAPCCTWLPSRAVPSCRPQKTKAHPCCCPSLQPASCWATGVDHAYWGRPEEYKGARRVYVWNRTSAASDLLGMVKRSCILSFFLPYHPVPPCSSSWPSAVLCTWPAPPSIARPAVRRLARQAVPARIPRRHSSLCLLVGLADAPRTLYLPCLLRRPALPWPLLASCCGQTTRHTPTCCFPRQRRCTAGGLRYRVSTAAAFRDTPTSTRPTGTSTSSCWRRRGWPGLQVRA